MRQQRRLAPILGGPHLADPVVSPVRKAVLLAAGRGKRLGALTANQPKPMIPVQGVPVLERIMAGLAEAGIAEFAVIVGYLGEAIRAHFGDGARFGVRIEYHDQVERHGTGAALQLAAPFARGESVLMSFGDILVDPANYRGMLAAHSAGLDALVGINHMDDVSAGAAVYREGDRVVRMIEKPGPDAPECHWNQAGVSVFGPAIWPALERLTPSARGEYELTAAVAHLIETGKRVNGYEIRGFWSDIGTPEDLAAADRAWADR